VIERFNRYLQQQMEALPEDTVSEAMAYSLLAPGKRVRPALLFDVVKGYGKSTEDALPAAAAIEMVHTYSLIHDDLPAMDNDDLRRGRPTCHIQFGENTAILAGDALLTLAFDQMASVPADPKTVLEMVRLLSQHAGILGMVLGQSQDLAFEKETPTPEKLLAMHALKTGKLLQLPLACGALLAGHAEDIDLWMEAGYWIGLQFQLKDDLLDLESEDMQKFKSTSDARNDKSTGPSILGLQECQRLMEQGDAKIASVLEQMAQKGFDRSYLDATLHKLAGRTY
jgi:geranylgeranyl diphosphate synthase type II